MSAAFLQGKNLFNNTPEAITSYNGSICVMPFDLAHALEVIKSDYGVDAYYKPKTLFKFGLTINTNSSQRVTIAEFQGGAASTVFNEVYATDNTIDRIVSDNTNDTEVITVEGHTLSGGNLTFQTQQVTLNGQTPVALTTPLARANRLSNDNGTNLAGDVYCYDSTEATGVTTGVPDVASATKVMITAGNDQSEKGATSISSVDYYVITQLFAAINKGSGSSATCDVRLESRTVGKVFRPKGEKITVSSAANSTEPVTLSPPIIIPANSDVRLTAFGSANDLLITGSINGYLATARTS